MCINAELFKIQRDESIHDVYVSMAISHSVCHVTTRPSSHERSRPVNIEKIIFKVVQMKFLAMHITNKKLSFDIFTEGNLLNIFMEHDLNILMIFGIKEKWVILTPTMYCWLLLQIYLCCL